MTTANDAFVFAEYEVKKCFECPLGDDCCNVSFDEEDVERPIECRLDRDFPDWCPLINGGTVLIKGAITKKEE